MTATVVRDELESIPTRDVPPLKHVYIWKEDPPPVERSLCGMETRPAVRGVGPKTLREIRQEERRCKACIRVAEEIGYG